MKTKIKVDEIFNISDRIIFAVTVEGDKYLIGDIFSNQDANLKFELKGIAMENQPQSNKKSLLVILLEDYNSIEDFQDKEFIKYSEEKTKVLKLGIRNGKKYIIEEKE